MFLLKNVGKTVQLKRQIRTNKILKLPILFYTVDGFQDASLCIHILFSLLCVDLLINSPVTKETTKAIRRGMKKGVSRWFFSSALRLFLLQIMRCSRVNVHSCDKMKYILGMFVTFLMEFPFMSIAFNVLYT